MLHSTVLNITNNYIALHYVLEQLAKLYFSLELTDNYIAV